MKRKTSKIKMRIKRKRKSKNVRIIWFWTMIWNWRVSTTTNLSNMGWSLWMIRFFRCIRIPCCMPKMRCISTKLELRISKQHHRKTMTSISTVYHRFYRQQASLSIKSRNIWTSSTKRYFKQKLMKNWSKLRRKVIWMYRKSQMSPAPISQPKKLTSRW